MSDNRLFEYKENFIRAAIEKGVLSHKGPFKLKSGRKSPYFFNSGNFADGESSAAVGDAYAAAVLEHIGAEKFDVLLGPPYKGIPLAVMMARSLYRLGVNKRFAFYRKEEKTHGEGTEESRDARKKRLIVGDLRDGDRVVIPDDVITTGGAKYDAIEVMENVVEGAKHVAVVIAMNRQEIDEFGSNAIEELERKTGMRVVSALMASDYFDFLDKSGELNTSDREAFRRYFRAWGTQELRDQYELKDGDIILRDRTVIPACDVRTIEKFERLVEATAQVDEIGGYKIGFSLGLRYGLPRLVEIAKKHAPDKAIIYDHQKAGTDIPDTGEDFARLCAEAGVDAVILFPQSGPVTQVRWVGEALQHGLKVIVGGEMTHKGYKASEGGRINDAEIDNMYLLAAKQGVRHFVVPGNKPQRIRHFRNILEGAGVENPIFYAPGFIDQGGKISEAGEAAGERWHAIVGRAIVDAEDMAGAAIEMTRQITVDEKFAIHQ